MWYAGASQSNGAAYLLCFTVIGVTIVSAMHAWANLRGIEISSGPIRPVFAGDEMRLPLVVRGSLGARARGHRSTDSRRTADCDRRAAAGRTATNRDRGEGGAAADVSPISGVELVSLFPLGFFTASRHVTVHEPHWVYPKPAGALPLPRSPAGTRSPQRTTSRGRRLRRRAGVSPRGVAAPHRLEGGRPRPADAGQAMGRAGR